MVQLETIKEKKDEEDYIPFLTKWGSMIIYYQDKDVT